MAHWGLLRQKTNKQNYLTNEIHVSATLSNQNQAGPKIIKRKEQYSWNIFRSSRTLQMCYVKYITYKICILGRNN